MAPVFRRYVLETDAPLDEFRTALGHALAARRIAVGRARAFDASVQGPSARGWFRLEADERGVALVVKTKGGIFAGDTPAARSLADAVLDAARDAQRALLGGAAASPM